MRALREFTRPIKPLWELVDKVCGYPLAQAVYVEPNPAWQLAWRRVRIGGGAEPIPLHWLRRSGMADVMAIQDSQLMDPEYDFSWYPKSLKEHLRCEFPLWVRIHLCPRQLDTDSARAQRGSILSIAANYGRHFRITVEDRPLAVLALQSGDRVQGTSMGTVGGFLRDSSPQGIYGVTCGHVAPAGTVSDAAGRPLGSVVHATSLSPSANQLCRPNAAAVNQLDAALFDVSGGAVASGLSGPTQNYGSGQIASMNGGVSGGPHAYAVGGLALIHKIHYAGRDYCFKDLFSIRTRLTAPVGFMSAALAVAPVPCQGDSGAWITIAGGGWQREWIGMLIGVDQIEGFALDAEEVMKWASKVTGANLSVY